MRGWVARLVVVIGLAGAGHAPAEDGPPRDLSSYVVFGLEGVRLHDRVELFTGDVGTNRGTLHLGRRTTVLQAAAAGAIRLGRGTRVGQLFCDTVTGPATSPCEPLLAPVIDSSQLELVQVFPGAVDVRVPRRAESVPLAAGAYGVLEAGARSRLLLRGGSYSFRSISIRRHASVLCLRRCELDVQEDVVVHRGAVLGVVESLEPSALAVSIESSGKRRSLEARSHATVTGSVYAPNGDLVLGPRGRYAGRFVGGRVSVGRRAQVTASATSS